MIILQLYILSKKITILLLLYYWQLSPKDTQVYVLVQIRNFKTSMCKRVIYLNFGVYINVRLHISKTPNMDIK